MRYSISILVARYELINNIIFNKELLTKTIIIKKKILFKYII